MQKGSAQIFLIASAVIVILTGIFYLSQKLKKDDLQISPQVNSPIETINTHTDQNMRFELSYPSEMTLKTDTEEEFNTRGNGNFRKNFKGYVGYEPGKFLGGVVVLDETGSYETNPFTLWVFNNINNLTIEQWYKEYWYYPFVWGDYTLRRNDVAPINEATVSGQMGQYGVVTYREGYPKFIYLKNNEKMYFFRVINDSENLADKILESFKLLE